MSPGWVHYRGTRFLFRQALLQQRIAPFPEVVEELGVLFLEVGLLVQVLREVEEVLVALGSLQKFPVALPQGGPGAALQLCVGAGVPEQLARRQVLLDAGEDARDVLPVKLVGRVVDFGQGTEGWKKIQRAQHRVARTAGLDLARPTHQARHADAALEERRLLAAERFIAPAKFIIAAVVGHENDQRIALLPVGLEGGQYAADSVVQVHHLGRERPPDGGLDVFYAAQVFGVGLHDIDGQFLGRIPAFTEVWSVIGQM